MLGLTQYGRADGTTILRNHMVCKDTEAVPLSLVVHPPFLSWKDCSLSVPSLGVMLGLIVVAYRSKHADELMSEISSVMVLTGLCLRSTKECAGVGRVAQREYCSRACRSCPSTGGHGAQE